MKTHEMQQEALVCPQTRSESSGGGFQLNHSDAFFAWHLTCHLNHASRLVAVLRQEGWHIVLR